ncbi:MAG: YicC family protein [Lentisphaeria bacterium]|nr:YicC family protein [Lentisphaeria bacterium]
MIYSMTGFGKTSPEVFAATKWNFEISSVNRKQLEVRINLPREFTALETEIRTFLKGRISRGMVNIKGTFTPDPAEKTNSVTVNHELLDELVTAALTLKKRHPELADSVCSINSFFNIPGVINAPEIDTENPELVSRILQSLDSALQQFNTMRKTEGSALEKDLRSRLDYLKSLLDKIIPFTAEINRNIKQKLLDRCQESGLNIDLNDERLQKEIIFYADKGDVSEEITRLKSHFVQFDKFLSNDASDAGRSLDFLIQEMFREINTLGNKSGSCDISPLVVAFKTELEKMREQIQNAE